MGEAAGCDGVLICSGDHATQAAALEALPNLNAVAVTRARTTAAPPAISQCSVASTPRARRRRRERCLTIQMARRNTRSGSTGSDWGITASPKVAPAPPPRLKGGSRTIPVLKVGHTLPPRGVT